MKFFRVKSETGSELIVAEADVNGREVLGEFAHPAYADLVPVEDAKPTGLPPGLVRIKNPDVAGAFLVIGERDFNPAIHERFDAPTSVPATPAPEPEKSSQEPSDDATKDNAAQVDPALASVLDRPAAEIYPLIADTAFDQVQLAQLQHIETRGKARKTVLEVIAGKMKIAPLSPDGPTLAQYVEAGYSAANYPPSGYAARA